MNQYTLESFVSFCDDMQITTEASAFQSIKAKIVKAFSKLIDLIESKVKKMKDSKFKSTLLKLLSRAKIGLSKSKSLKSDDNEKAEELANEAREIKDECDKIDANDTISESNDDKNGDTTDADVGDNKSNQRKKYKIANPRKYEHKEVIKCSDNNDLKSIKYIFVDCLDVDPTFIKYQKSYEYAKNHCDGFPEEHKELTKFESDKSKWNMNYYVKLKVDYLKNGSDERLRHMRDVVKVTHADKIERLRKERLQRAFSKKMI